MRRRLTALVFVLFVLFVLFAHPASAAPTLTLSGDVRGGGGYDSALFLDLVPDPASDRYHEASGAFARVAPALSGRLDGDRLHLELRYLADIKTSSASGALYFQEVALGLRSSEIGRFRFAVTAGGNRFDPPLYPEDRFWSLGAGAAVVVRLGESARTALRYRIDGRRYPDAIAGAEENTIHSGDLSAAYSPIPDATLAVGAGYFALRADTAAAIDRVRGTFDASLVLLPGLDAAVSLWVGRQHVRDLRDDDQLGGYLGARWRFGDHVTTSVSYELFTNVSGDPAADVARHVVAVDLTIHGSLQKRPPSPPPPVRVEPGGRSARFRLPAPGATTVRVVGSWNDWATDGQALARSGDPAVWEAEFEIAAGRHRFHYLVDDRPVRPPDAETYVPDGFGGEDAILEVP